MLFENYIYICITKFKYRYMSKRRIAKSKRQKILQEIKNSTPSIVFKAHNLVVTLRNKSQLNTWLKLYPEGTYTIN